MSNKSYSSPKSLAKHDDHVDDEALKSNNKDKQEEVGDYGCQTPTSDDHKIPQLPLPPPRRHLHKRRERLLDDVEFFEKTRREEVDEFFRLFTIRVSSSSSSRKRRSHSI